MITKPSLIILSGGVESVSLAVAEAAWRHGHRYAVLSLNRSSLLEGLPGCISCESLWSEDMQPSDVADRLLDRLAALRQSVGRVIPVLPTEDDGLYLLHSVACRLEGVAEFSRGLRLPMGGLDKIELFRLLEKSDLKSVVPRFLELNSIAQLDEALDVLGDDAVIKPAFKPWQKSLGGGGLKVVSRFAGDESRSSIARRLTDVWPLAKRWLVQERLQSLRGGERSVCIVRAKSVRGCQVVELFKYPRMGGSAVVVDIDPGTDLLPLAGAIAEVIDLHGICEMSFLADRSGQPRLVEVNTRPWLQIELVEHAGFPIVHETVQALSGDSQASGQVAITSTRWVQLERLMLCWLTGNNRDGLRALGGLIGVLRSRPYFAVYDLKLPGAGRRWLARMFGAAFSKLLGIRVRR